MTEVEYLECYGGPLDGGKLSSLGYPDIQPWGDEGYYIRTPASLIRVIVRRVRDGSDNPLLRLVNDGWVWRQVMLPPGAAELYMGGPLR